MSRKRRKKRTTIKPIIFILVLCIILTGIFVACNKEPDNNDDKLDLSEINEEDKIIDNIEEDKYENKKITIAAAGDIMFHMSQIKGAYNKETGDYNFKNFFEPVKDIIESADIAIANFEGTTAGDDVYSYRAYPTFNAPDEVLDAIKYAGFDVLSTANNHTIDTGKLGIERTLEKINDRGMNTIGTFKEKPESRILIKDVNGIKLAFLSYTFGCNGLEQLLSEEELDTMVNIIDRDKISKDISDAKEAGTDMIIAYVHWGYEYNRNPSTDQRDLADYMFNEGVDIILGSHPHVIQDSKSLEYDNKSVFVAYSMGNFISNQRFETLNQEGIRDSQYTEDGIILKFEIEKDEIADKTEIKAVNFVPTWVYRYKQANGLWDYRIYPVMEYIESDDVDEETKGRMHRSYNDTMSKMNINN